MSEASLSSDVSFRIARHEDLPALVQMLADDPLGAKREAFTLPLPAGYESAFAAIASDPNNELLVAQAGTELLGMLQLTFIPHLTHQGGWRALVEGVRVSRLRRSSGIGRLLLQTAIQRARERGCIMVQLTTDKARPEALRFYENIGFVASHEGMKLSLQ